MPDLGNSNSPAWLLLLNLCHLELTEFLQPPQWYLVLEQHTFSPSPCFLSQGGMGQRAQA